MTPGNLGRIGVKTSDKSADSGHQSQGGSQNPDPPVWGSGIVCNIPGALCAVLTPHGAANNARCISRPGLPKGDALTGRQSCGTYIAGINKMYLD
eukprot:gene24794-biopygen22426